MCALRVHVHMRACVHVCACGGELLDTCPALAVGACRLTKAVSSNSNPPKLTPTFFPQVNLGAPTHRLAGPDICSRFEAKPFDLSFIRPENLCLSPLGVLLQNPFLCLVSFTEERLPLGHSARKPRSVECCSDSCPSGSFSHLHLGSLNLSRSDHQLLGHQGTFSPDC